GGFGGPSSSSSLSSPSPAGASSPRNSAQRGQCSRPSSSTTIASAPIKRLQWSHQRSAELNARPSRPLTAAEPDAQLERCRPELESLSELVLEIAEIALVQPPRDE